MPQAIPAALSIGAKLIGSKVVGSGIGSAVASIAGSALTSRTADRAADAQVAAADRAAQVQRQNFLDTMAMIRPQIQAGDAARAQMMSELGLSMQTQGGGGGNYVGGIPGSPNYSQYVTGSQGLSRAYSGLNGPQRQYIAERGYDLDEDGRISAEEYGRFHYNTYGRGEGRQLPTVADNKMPVQDTGVAGSGDASDDPYARFRNTPGYQFQLAEGQRAIDSSAASRGGLMRGSTLARLQEFGQGLADQTYGQYYNRLAALAGMGQTASGSAASLGSSTASNLGNIYMGAGDARASSYLTQGAGQQGALGSIFNAAGSIFGGKGF